MDVSEGEGETLPMETVEDGVADLDRVLVEEAEREEVTLPLFVSECEDDSERLEETEKLSDGVVDALCEVDLDPLEAVSDAVPELLLLIVAD